MRIPLCIAVVLMAAIAACTATQPPAAAAPPADAPLMPLPPGASGKISPEMVGKVSPIPAMMASGEDWTLDMQGTQGMDHHAVLQLSRGPLRLEGTLTFRETITRDGISSMRLDGRLESAEGVANAIVVVDNAPCKDREGNIVPHTIRILLGRQELQGCAQVAVY